MSIIKNTNVTVIEAILTKKGREILSTGMQNFKITKFAVADDEVDYGLWDSSKPTDEKGESIEALPILESSPDESKNMRYKLISYNDPNTIRVPQITNINQSNIALDANETFVIEPNTLPTEDSAGYTCYVTNGEAAELLILEEINNNGLNVRTKFSTGQRQLVGTGKSFKIKAKAITSEKTGQIIIVGNGSGATYTINFVVNPIDENYIVNNPSSDY